MERDGGEKGERGTQREGDRDRQTHTHRDGDRDRDGNDSIRSRANLAYRMCTKPYLLGDSAKLVC